MLLMVGYEPRDPSQLASPASWPARPGKRPDGVGFVATAPSGGELLSRLVTLLEEGGRGSHRVLIVEAGVKEPAPWPAPAEPPGEPRVLAVSCPGALPVERRQLERVVGQLGTWRRPLACFWIVETSLPLPTARYHLLRALRPVRRGRLKILEIEQSGHGLQRELDAADSAWLEGLGVVGPSPAEASRAAGLSGEL